MIDDSPFHLKGSFPGPEDTPYQGGHFEVVSIIYKILLIPGLNFRFILGHHYPSDISVPTSEDEIHNQSVSSECFVCIRGNLSRHSERCLVPCPHFEIDFDLSPISTLLS